MHSTESTHPPVSNAITQLLTALGHDVRSAELSRTADRVARYAVEMMSSREEPRIPPGARIPASAPGPIVVHGIPYRSTCTHHLLPFTGAVDIVYQPTQWILGFGRLVGLVADCSRRLQLQERLAAQVADVVLRDVGADAVLVRVLGTHLCASSGESGLDVTTLVVRGRYENDLLERDAALTLLRTGAQ